MNKKILIGSIIAVAILVMVSFTGVVGYQTTKSSTIAKASPLFAVRSSRAIDEDSEDLTCDYVGKGNNVVIPFLTRTRTKPIQKFMQRIRTMDDKAFNKFMFLAINKLYRSNVFKEGQIRDIIQEFQHMRKDSNYPIYLTAQCQTIGRGCLIYLLWMLLMLIIDYITHCTMINSGCYSIDGPC